MKKTIWLVIFFLLPGSMAYAQDTAGVTEGVAQYNWESCVNSLSANCVNNCATSEDRDCKDQCLSTAEDKCISVGIGPPPGTVDTD